MFWVIIIIIIIIIYTQQTQGERKATTFFSTARFRSEVSSAYGNERVSYLDEKLLTSDTNVMYTSHMFEQAFHIEL